MQRIVLSKDKITLDLSAERLSHSQIVSQGGDQDEIVRIERSHDLAPMRGARRLLSSMSTQPRIDSALVRAVVQARRWHGELVSGEATSIQDIARRENACPIYTGQLLPLAFLAPDLIEAILDGRQPPRLSLIGLIKASLPLRWSEQRALFAQFA